MPDPSDSRYRTTAAEAASPPESAPEVARAPAERNGERNERWIDRLRARLGLKTNASARQNLEDVLEENAPSSAGFSPEERSMLRNILELRESRVGDLAQPRADINAVQKDIFLAALMETFENAGHTRLVVYDDTLDDPVGMVHIKDFVKHIFTEARKATKKKRSRARADAKLADSKLVEDAPPKREPRSDNPKTIADLDLGAVDLNVALASTRLVRPILFVPPSMPAIDLLARMQATRIQLALVVDEYGGTDGLIAMEDIVESIVGDIEDEHDVDDGRTIATTADGAFLADARATLDEVREALGPEFEPGEQVTDEVDTLGGYLTVLAGHVPVRGELVAGPGEFEFEVIDADPRRVKRVKITRGRSLIDKPARGRRKDEEEQSATAAAASTPAGVPTPAAGSPDALPEPVSQARTGEPGPDIRKAS
jgi:CBS domain containing-hemolysin-like protein